MKKRILASLIAASTILGTTMPTYAAEIALVEPEQQIVVCQGVGFSPLASDVISSGSLSISSTSWLCSVSLNASYSGTLEVEIQKKNGSSWEYYDSKSTSFTSTRSPYVSKTKSTGSGTYRAVVTVTINGTSTTRTTGTATV